MILIIYNNLFLINKEKLKFSFTFKTNSFLTTLFYLLKFCITLFKLLLKIDSFYLRF